MERTSSGGAEASEGGVDQAKSRYGAQAGSNFPAQSSDMARGRIELNIEHEMRLSRRLSVSVVRYP